MQNLRMLFAALSIHLLAGAQQAGAPPRIDPRGCVGARVIAGGGALPPEVLAAFIALAGGPQAEVVLVPTASAGADSAEARARTLASWQEDFPDASFSILHTRDRAEADTASFCEPLETATAVWFGGGAQQRLADAYVGTRFERELEALTARGGVVGGSSAGAAAQSRVMIARGNPSPELSTGFDLLPGAIIDQHFLARGRMPRLVTALGARAGRFGLGVDEGTAVVVRGRDVRVVGRSQALLLLPASEGKPQRVQRLQKGDRADLVTWQRAAQQRALGPWPPVSMPAPRVTRGTVMLGGGGGMPRAVFERFVERAGGADAARIVVAPTATPRRPGDRQDRVAKLLRSMGVADVVVLEPRHPDEVTDAHVAMIDRATGVWFGGGRQWRTVDAFDGTPIIAAFHRVLERGGVIAGSSAGASIQGELLVRGNPLGNTDMWCEGYDRGFALLSGCAVDQHFVARRRLPDLQGVIARFPQVLGVGVDEGTCAVVSGSVLEVLGRSKVAIVDARLHTGKGPIPPHWVQAGERWDLVRGQRQQ